MITLLFSPAAATQTVRRGGADTVAAWRAVALAVEAPLEATRGKSHKCRLRQVVWPRRPRSLRHGQRCAGIKRSAIDNQPPLPDADNECKTLQYFRWEIFHLAPTFRSIPIPFEKLRNK